MSFQNFVFVFLFFVFLHFFFSTRLHKDGKRDETPEERAKRKEKEKREENRRRRRRETRTRRKRAARKAAKSKSSDGKSRDERKEKSAKASKQSGGSNAALKEKKPKTRGPPVMEEKNKSDYLAGMDLPSSSDDEDVEEKVERDLSKTTFDGPSEKEAAKAREKEIEMARKEAMAKKRR